MPAAAEVEVVFDVVVNGQRERRFARGTTIEAFRVTINQLAGNVGVVKRDLMTARCALGAVLVQLRSKFPRGTWQSFIASLSINAKTARNAIRLVEELCDEHGRLCQAKVDVAKSKRPEVGEPDTLHRAERLAGLRVADDHASSAKHRNGTIVPQTTVQRQEVSGTVVPFLNENPNGYVGPVVDVAFDDDEADDAFDDSGLPDEDDAPMGLIGLVGGDDDGGDDWGVGAQLSFEDLRTQARDRLADAITRIDSIEPAKRGALEVVLRDLDRLLN